MNTRKIKQEVMDEPMLRNMEKFSSAAASNADMRRNQTKNYTANYMAPSTTVKKEPLSTENGTDRHLESAADVSQRKCSCEANRLAVTVITSPSKLCPEHRNYYACVMYLAGGKVNIVRTADKKTVFLVDFGKYQPDSTPNLEYELEKLSDSQGVRKPKHSSYKSAAAFADYNAIWKEYVECVTQYTISENTVIKCFIVNHSYGEYSSFFEHLPWETDVEAILLCGNPLTYAAHSSFLQAIRNRVRNKGMKVFFSIYAREVTEIFNTANFQDTRNFLEWDWNFTKGFNVDFNDCKDIIGEAYYSPTNSKYFDLHGSEVHFEFEKYLSCSDFKITFPILNPQFRKIVKRFPNGIATVKIIPPAGEIEQCSIVCVDSGNIQSLLPGDATGYALARAYMLSYERYHIVCGPHVNAPIPIARTDVRNVGGIEADFNLCLENLWPSVCVLPSDSLDYLPQSFAKKLEKLPSLEAVPKHLFCYFIFDQFESGEEEDHDYVEFESRKAIFSLQLKPIFIYMFKSSINVLQSFDKRAKAYY